MTNVAGSTRNELPLHFPLSELSWWEVKSVAMGVGECY